MTYLEKYEKQEKLLKVFNKGLVNIDKVEKNYEAKLASYLCFPILLSFSIIFIDKSFSYMFPIVLFSFLPFIIISLYKLNKSRKNIKIKMKNIENNKNELKEPFLSLAYNEIINGNVTNIEEMTIKKVLNAKIDSMTESKTVNELLSEIELKKRFQFEQSEEIINE